jgi:centromere protein C
MLGKAIEAKANKDINQEPDSDEDSVDDQGLRRGRRKRYAPLEWWRLERVEYGRGKELAEIKRIVRLPKEPTRTLGAKKRGLSSSQKPRSRSGRGGTAGAGDGGVDEDLLEEAERRTYNPEEGWDANTRPDGVVVDFVTQEEIDRRVAWTAAMVRTKPAENDEFQFQKIFGDAGFIAAGQLLIPPGGKKPSKNTKDNSYVSGLRSFTTTTSLSILTNACI